MNIPLSLFRTPVAFCLFLGLGLFFGPASSFAQDEIPAQRAKAATLQKAGNWKEALAIFRDLLGNKKNGGVDCSADLRNAKTCIDRLGTAQEYDSVLEMAVEAHAEDWLVLREAARIYKSLPQYGFMISGEFKRGNHRGGNGTYVYSMYRDRVRSLQLYAQAVQCGDDEENKSELSAMHVEFADSFQQTRGRNEAWRLQALTDLTELPDYEPGYYNGSRDVGTPVTADGNPLFYHVPASWEKSISDGERWRWLLKRAVEIDASREFTVEMRLADFLHSQFGVQTMANRWWGRPVSSGLDDEDGTKKNESGVFDVHTLKDDESITRLATGIKRHQLPVEFSFVARYKAIIGNRKAGGVAETAYQRLAEIYENRRQYPAAATMWRENIKKFGSGKGNWKGKRLNQIVDNWARFDGTMTQPAGNKATVGFVYRNAQRVDFTAFRIKTDVLLKDVKAYIKTNPERLDWNKINLNNIGWRLIHDDQKKYGGKKVASWDLRLEPRENHWDRRIDVVTPLQEPGGYLVEATLADGNTSFIVVWISDTVIVQKTIDKDTLYFVADAMSGSPVSGATVEFFGYKQEYIQRKKNDPPRARRYNILTKNFAEKTDESGLCYLGGKNAQAGYQWLITATHEDDGNRFAHLGFSGAWYNQHHDRDYNQTKYFGITDRPVYRPEQKVKFKIWVRQAKYDQDDVSVFANKTYRVEIWNPKNEKILDKDMKTDAFGGLDGEIELPKDATLGSYRIGLKSKAWGVSTFRVEEYKKPEFEVTVDAPKEPVMLGDKIEASIIAKYYFGAPVANGKVKYKVLRTAYNKPWYPPMRWDWFYGPGYWWFSSDYDWYPGWRKWGCTAPRWHWWPAQQSPPEVVSENEVEIGPDGVVKVLIDTAPAKAAHGDIDHRYEITAEVVDESRRTIVGKGAVLVARKPFKVNLWADRGYYRVGDNAQVSINARTLDNKPVEGKGVLRVLAIDYGDDGKPVEKEVQKLLINTNERGEASHRFNTVEKGQFRVSYTLTDKKDHTIEGGYFLVVRGDGFDGRDYRFNDLEIVTEKMEYAPGEKVSTMINTERADSTVLFFVRPSNGVYLKPRVLNLKGKSAVEEVAVTRKDMPNFFLEVLTVSNGKVFTQVREVVVPPEKRMVNVEVLPGEEKYKPGEKAKVKIKLTDLDGKPFVGDTVVTVYDKALEYISGGGNVADIKEFFWKWRRHHRPTTIHSLNRSFSNLGKKGADLMAFIGAFGQSLAEGEEGMDGRGELGKSRKMDARRSGRADFFGEVARDAAPMAKAESAGVEMDSLAATEAPGGERNSEGEGGGGGPGGADVQPTIRTNFADAVYWTASLKTGDDGIAEIELDMPENLTTWKIKTWGLGHGTKVGQGEAEVITSKDLLIRLQAPRFFVDTDEVVLSANVHNYLEDAKDVKVVLDLAGGTLTAIDKDQLTQSTRIEANGEKRIDWRVAVKGEGQATVTMKAITDEESDAMQMSYPVFIHGMLKTESWSGAIRPEGDTGVINLVVPAERRPAESVLEIRYSPTIAMAMVDALPYLAEYPYGCTEQTLSRFLPAVMTQKTLQRMGLDLKDIQKKMSNLNPQEIGNDVERAKQWKRYQRNPVFNEGKLVDMVKTGVNRLTQMQNSDGGWGWFSGQWERSYPHTTAYVVHGLLMARANDVVIVPGVLNNGVTWLKRYQAGEVQKLKNAKTKTDPWKSKAGHLDAFVYMVLLDADVKNEDMKGFLYRDKNDLAVYAKAMFGLALDKEGDKPKRDELIRNIRQFVKIDDENQSAWLELNNGGYWWYWYGSEYEAHAYFLKLLARTEPKGKTASGMVKYLINNRKHGTYWSSTRDTAVCIEAIGEYLQASGEAEPDMTVEIFIDGEKKKEVKISKDNLFSYDNKLVLKGDAVTTGKHKVEFRRKGKGPLYYNAYLTNFTLEDFIAKAGLEVKVNRKYFKLVPEEKKVDVVGARGQAVSQKVEKFKRVELNSGDTIKSGDLVEIELTIESKNDYEYLMFEDMKASGFEPYKVQSGYHRNGMGAYMELRDEKVAFFVRQLPRGKHSIVYKMRAEIPGKFSALPTRAEAMYAPELKANSDEIKVSIVD